MPCSPCTTALDVITWVASQDFAGHTCIAWSAKYRFRQAVVLVYGVAKVADLEDGVGLVGFQQNVFQLDVPIDNTDSAEQMVCNA